MSSLYLKGKHIYIETKVNGRWKGINTGLTMEVVKRKDGKIIYPKEAYDLKRQIDLHQSLNKFGLLPKQKVDVNISTLLKEYLEYKRNVITKTTEQQYHFAIDKLIAQIGDISVMSVTDKMIAKCRGIWLDTLSQHTVAKTLRQLSAVFEFASSNKNQYCEYNPVAELKIYPPKDPPETFSQDELVAFFKECKKVKIDLFNQLMFLLLTGFRVDESCRLVWDRVDIPNEIIRHENTKGKRKEHYHMDALLLNFMIKLPRRTDGRVFKYKNRRTLWDWFTTVKKSSKIREVLTVHSLKATYATSLYETDANLLTIQQLAHHSDINVTREHYIQFKTNKNKESLHRSRKALPPEIRKLTRKAS